MNHLSILRRLGLARREDQIAHMTDLSRLDLIRKRDTTFLSDPSKLEHELIPELGLNNEKLHAFPSELSRYFGQGLLIWQSPAQFSKYLAKLSQLGVRSYMEIGVRHGGTFLTTVEYLKKFGGIEKAVAVDINDCPAIAEYSRSNPETVFVRMNTMSDEFRSYMESASFDLVLIDGDHTYEGCKSDLDTVKNSAKMIAFHDIEPEACAGVAKAWNGLKAEGAGVYDFYEFRDQYPSVKGRWLGIGLAVKKVR